MSDKTKAILVTVLFALVAFFLTPVLWPNPMHSGDAMAPSSTQITHFIILSVVEALSFGLGMAFIIVGWPYVKNMTGPMRNRAWTVYVAIAWLLVSWWPHDNLHKVNGENLAGLIRIEYGFHVTLIIAGIIVAYAFWKLLADQQGRDPSKQQ